MIRLANMGPSGAGKSTKDRASMICAVLDRFQIVGKKDLYPNQLSGGQRLALLIRDDNAPPWPRSSRGKRGWKAVY